MWVEHDMSPSTAEGDSSMYKLCCSGRMRSAVQVGTVFGSLGTSSLCSFGGRAVFLLDAAQLHLPVLFLC